MLGFEFSVVVLNSHLLPIALSVLERVWDCDAAEGILSKSRVVLPAARTGGSRDILFCHQSSERSIESRYHSRHIRFRSLESEWPQGSQPPPKQP